MVDTTNPSQQQPSQPDDAAPGGLEDEALVEPEGVNAGSSDMGQEDPDGTDVQEEPAASPGPRGGRIET